MKYQIPMLVLFLLICLGAGWIGALLTQPSIPGWYQTLKKPSGTPPNWVFGPVWTGLYILMALAAWLVWRKGGFGPNAMPLGLFAIQLLLNIAWSGIFFGLQRAGLTFIEVAALWIMILAAALAFKRVSLPAFLLMIPYLAWVSYASWLNFWIWWLNRE